MSKANNGFISPKQGSEFSPGLTFMGPDRSVATVFDNPISNINAKKIGNGQTNPVKEDFKTQQQGEREKGC